MESGWEGRGDDERMNISKLTRKKSRDFMLPCSNFSCFYFIFIFLPEKGGGDWQNLVLIHSFRWRRMSRVPRPCIAYRGRCQQAEVYLTGTALVYY